VTAETPLPVDPQAARLQGIWVECLRQVLGQVAGFPVTVEASTSEELASQESAPPKPPACMVVSASKTLQGDMAILAPEAGALALAQVLVSEPQDPTVPFDKDRRDAFDELIRQVLGQIATSLEAAAGGEVELKPSGNEAASWPDSTRQAIRITSEKFPPILLTLIVSPELLKSLQPAPAPAPPPAQKAEQPSAPQEPPPKSEPAPPQPEAVEARSSNLELLLDVKLDATIRFGQRRMLLREILELQPGTAVPLDRRVEEPVELLVGGRVVAQGDVVIVDGNYGIRITEILSPQQRIQSLGKHP
jgi:flagellar motor switch protein FliN/FliY